MVAATTALEALLDDTDRNKHILADAILTAHHALMAGDPAERDHAGRWREVQNWIGGSDHSSRTALYVPPPPDTVPGAITDLLTFANRDDVPVLAQAAVAHASSSRSIRSPTATDVSAAR